MPVTNHAITLFINSVDRTQYLIKDSVYCRLSVGNKSDVAEFKLKDFNPLELEQVEIKVNGTTLFGGYIINKSGGVLGASTKTVVWSIECKDWSLLTDKTTVDLSYTGSSDSSIVANLFSLYTTGFDAATFVTQLDADLDIDFTNISLRDALDKLADQVGATWFINAAKKVYWFLTTNPATANFSIDTSSPNNTTSFDILRNSLKYAIDASSIVNRITVNEGTKSTGTKITDTFTGDGTNKGFGNLTQVVDSILYVDFTDTADNHYTTYGSFIGYEPDDKLISEGGNKNVVVSADGIRIRMEGTTSLAPKNSSTITVVYYYKESIAFTVNDAVSQGLYGIYTQNILNKEFFDLDQATAYANSILDQYAYGRQSIEFSITRFGLLPGTLLEVLIAELDIRNLSDSINNVTPQTFLIQEIAYTCVVAGDDQFMIIANVSCGKAVRNIIDSLASIQDLKTNVGAESKRASQTRLSNVSSNLGEVVLGRAVFTDGGTAAFQWGSPGGATGAVIGLEDRNSNAYGAVYIYNGGSVKAKLGRLDDLPLMGTIQPSGWGLYTGNGFFEGIVAASQIIGGTVTGQRINGGTISGALVTAGTVSGNLVTAGTITGALITGNQITGGTFSTSTPPLNSSNPGVYMDSTGLYGYGSAGLTFRLSSNPAIKPYFSSGTITDAIYEITTASVIRTSLVEPRIQIDSSGIFAYDIDNDLRFSVDVSTGRLTANQGTFSGTINSSAVNAGTITGNLISGGTITGNQIVGGTVTSAYLNSGTINSFLISSGTFSAGYLIGGTVLGALVTAGSMTASQISGGTISGNLISGGTITGALVTGGTVQAGGGSVILDTTGAYFTMASGTAFYAPTTLAWKRSGVVGASLSGRYEASTDQLWLEAGVQGTKSGMIWQYAYGSAGLSLTYTVLQKDGFQVWKYPGTDGGSEPVFGNDYTSVYVYRSIVPRSDYATVNLGSVDTGFRYIYLRDSAHVHWRVEVNTSGTLVVTAA